MEIEIWQAFFYVAYILIYPCKNLQQHVEERVNGALEPYNM